MSNHTNRASWVPFPRILVAAVIWAALAAPGMAVADAFPIHPPTLRDLADVATLSLTMAADSDAEQLGWPRARLERVAIHTLRALLPETQLVPEAPTTLALELIALPAPTFTAWLLAVRLYRPAAVLGSNRVIPHTLPVWYAQAMFLTAGDPDLRVGLAIQGVLGKLAREFRDPPLLPEDPLCPHGRGCGR